MEEGFLEDFEVDEVVFFQGNRVTVMEVYPLLVLCPCPSEVRIQFANGRQVVTTTDKIYKIVE